MLRDIHFKAKAIPLFLLVLCMLSFGVMVHRLGFYWDDWPSIWFLHVFGPAGFIKGFEIDRPLLATVFILTTSLFGESMLAWQLFGIFTRWLSSLALFWALHGLWPGRTRLPLGVAVLFAVYPGFAQQYISVTYSNAFLVYAIFIISLGAMIWAFRFRRWFWPLLTLSYLCLFFSIFVSEYFFGLEFLRPFILWLVLQDQVPDRARRLRRVLLYWLPYGMIMFLFMVWRLFIHQSPRASITILDQLRGAPLNAMLNLGLTVLADLFEVTLLAWVKLIFHIREIFAYDWIIVLSGAFLSIGATIVAVFLLRRFREGKIGQSEMPPADGRSIKQAVALGILALSLGGVPIWVTNLHIGLNFPWDRFTIPMMLGVSILLAGLVQWVSRKSWHSAVLFGVLVGLASVANFYSALTFRQDWLIQKSFFWQLVWRAPGIEPGTTILTADLPFTYYSDNSLTAPLNWTYAPEFKSGLMPYMMYNIESRLGDSLPSLDAGIPIQQGYRVTSFTGSTDQAVVLFYDPPRCLKVVDSQLDRNLPYKPLYIPDILPLSKPEYIQAAVDFPASPPEAILGPEPEHDWCYYFEKAELARQVGDWQNVVQLGELALKLDKQFTRETASELVPFIDGYAHMRQWDKAVQLSLHTYQTASKTQNILCQTWYEIWSADPQDPQLQEAILRLENEIQCKFP